MILRSHNPLWFHQVTLQEELANAENNRAVLHHTAQVGEWTDGSESKSPEKFSEGDIADQQRHTYLMYHEHEHACLWQW